MANAKIFLVSPHENLTPMTETAYVREDVLQRFLERYPDLLAGDQINPDAPRRWLLVRREMPVPGDETETGRWSLDHLFLDQDGVPTFVECKRAADTRSRREVVAQMLDYAANGVEYWGIDRIRQAAAETARAQGQELDEQVRRLTDTGDEAEVETYWKTVEENLRRGRVRLLFVADETTKELRRLVEFLNAKMADVEVLAVEIKQFLGEGQTALVPRVIGITERARLAKGSTSTAKRTQTPAEFLATCTPEAARVFESVIARAQAKGHTIYWGGVGFSVRAKLRGEKGMASFVYGWPPDQLDFYFGHLPLTSDEATQLRTELLGSGVFGPAGEKTLKTRLAGDTLARIEQVYETILARIEAIIATH